MAQSSLTDLLAEVLPKHTKITVRHISTPPSVREALFSAAPGCLPGTTFCEHHFLAVTLKQSDAVSDQTTEGDSAVDDEVIVYGIEVLIYTTDRLTTLFVSKADSTGYLHNLLKKGINTKPSLLRLISTTFLSWLVDTRRRPGVRLVLSLFARSQNQYLFAGSIHNPGKHVLDDRGLVKWWCRVVDPILRKYDPEGVPSEQQMASAKGGTCERSCVERKSVATAYLVVPSCDLHETRAFFPPAARAPGVDDPKRPRWRSTYPHHQICPDPTAPPRCLIPRFPDDPKARFLIDLDDELPENVLQKSDQGKEEQHLSPQADGLSGHWKSVKSLEQFWEMMSFRQECSAGRLVGFLWLVVNPSETRSEHNQAMQAAGMLTASTGTKRPVEYEHTLESGPVISGSPVLADNVQTIPKESTDFPSEIVNGTVCPIEQASTELLGRKLAVDTDSNPFTWPEIGRGEIILSDADYKIAADLLMEQDFDTEEFARQSTMRWIQKVAVLADVLWWGQPVKGKKEISEPFPSISTTEAAPIAHLLIRKRKKFDIQDTVCQEGETESDSISQKPSSTSDDQGERGGNNASSATSNVNILSPSLVRKKKKTT